MPRKSVYVTGFVPIPGHPRSAEEYDRLGKELMEGCAHPIIPFTQSLEATWMYKFIDWRKQRVDHAVADNPAKNTLAYHAVQHQKTHWLVAAANLDSDADVFVWIDWGILSVPGITLDHINGLLPKTVNEPAITIPGCWPYSEKPISSSEVCWRFCGGIIIVPRSYVLELDAAFKFTAMQHIKIANKAEWEVNTLARLERSNLLPIWWYAADHDPTMFTNYVQSRFVS